MIFKCMPSSDLLNVKYGLAAERKTQLPYLMTRFHNKSEAPMPKMAARFASNWRPVARKMDEKSHPNFAAARQFFGRQIFVHRHVPGPQSSRKCGPLCVV